MNISTTAIKNSLVTFLHRFHILIFVVMVLGSLAVVIFLLNRIIIQSGDSGTYTSATGNTTFDETTIDRIKQLKTSKEQSAPLDLSKGRTNPFVE